MEEPRRLQFSTIGPPNKDKKKPQVIKTLRLDLDLTEATDETCPEFSYLELMKKSEGDGSTDRKSDSAVNEFGEPDPFGDQKKEDEKLEGIAKMFEAKYGPKPGKEKKKKAPQRICDLVDLGEGYDETDNFIDNSEAYDEIVPACLTTKLGGFYINCGVLDFREVSDNDSSDEFVRMNGSGKKRKAQRITSDSESEGEGEFKKKRGPKPKKKFADGFAGRKRKRLSGDGEKVFKQPRKPIDKWNNRKKRSPTVSELLKQQAASTSSPTFQLNGSEAAEGFHGIQDGNGFNWGATSSQDPSCPSGSLANIDSAIEAAISKGLQEDSNSQSDEKNAYDDPDSVPKLPSGLPPRLDELINKLKTAAQVSREGKCRFFTHEVNRMLLNVELDSKQLSCGTRQVIFAHLAAYLPCSKETLLKRAKKLRLNENDDKLKEPIQSLRDAINLVMPAQLDKHTRECQAAGQARLMDGKDKADYPTKEDASTESDEEDKCPQDVEKKRYMAPRRKFEWSNEIRNLLNAIVTIKMRTYDLSKLRAQSAEEYLKAFLDAEIKLLWPKGWVQTRMLFKESRLAHAPWTNQQRMKKPVIVTKAADSGMKTTSSEGISFGLSEMKSYAEVNSDLPMSLISSMVSSSEDLAQRELKTKVSNMPGLESGGKSQVSSTNSRNLLISEMPTILDYASHVSNSNTEALVSSTKLNSGGSVSSSKSHGGNRAGQVDSTSSVSTGARKPSEEPERNNTHNIALEILKSMRQVPKAARAPEVKSPIPQQQIIDKTAKPTQGQGDANNQSSFLAQFQKYASSIYTQQLQDDTKHHQQQQHAMKSPSLSGRNEQMLTANTSQNEYLQLWNKAKQGEITTQTSPKSKPSTPSPQSLAQQQQRQQQQQQKTSPHQQQQQQDKAHSSNRIHSPFTLLHQQLEQQQQKQKYRQHEPAHGIPRDHAKKDAIPEKISSRALQSGSGGDQAHLREAQQAAHSLLSQQQQLQQSMQQQQQNYVSLLQQKAQGQETHRLGQAKPPRPPSSAQTAKRQSLLAAAISSPVGNAVAVSSAERRLSLHKQTTANSSQDKPHHTVTSSMKNSGQGQSSSSQGHLSAHHQGHSSALHTSSLLSFKKKLGQEGQMGSPTSGGSPITTSSINPGALGLPTYTTPPSLLNPLSVAASNSLWNMISLPNSAPSPPVAHGSMSGGRPVTSAFSPPAAHSQPGQTSRTSPNYPGAMGLSGLKKIPSPTSSHNLAATGLQHSSRSPDSSRGVVSSTVPYGQSQLSPRGTHANHSPHGSPLGGLYGTHSPHSPRNAASPHSLFPPPHGASHNLFSLPDLAHYRYPDSNRSPHGY